MKIRSHRSSEVVRVAFVFESCGKREKMLLVINEVQEYWGCNSSPVLQEQCSILSEWLIYPDCLSPLLRFCLSAARGFWRLLYWFINAVTVGAQETIGRGYQGSYSTILRSEKHYGCNPKNVWSKCLDAGGTPLRISRRPQIDDINVLVR